MNKSSIFATVLFAFSSFTACINTDSVDQAELESLRAENESLKASTSTTVDIKQYESMIESLEVEVSVLEETTTPETTSEEITTTGSSKTVWETLYFVDEWGDQDENSPYLRTFSENGKFSNTATVNSELTTATLVDNQYAAFILYTYNSYDVVGPSDGCRYKITIVDESDTTTTIYGWLGSKSNQVCIFNQDYHTNTTEYDTFKELLRNNNKLKIKLEEQDDYSNDIYSFKLDCTGFSESYDQLFS